MRKVCFPTMMFLVLSWSTFAQQQGQNAPPKTASLIFRETFKGRAPGAEAEIPLTTAHAANPSLELKLYGPGAKAQPDQLNYASNGFGSTTQFATELFKLMTGTRIEHVPYKGLSLAMVDLVTGRVHIMFSSAVAMLPTVKEGKLRAIAMTGSKRSHARTDIPTVAESGVKDFESGSWYGILAPAGTPRPSVDRLNREIVVSVKSQDIQDRLVNEAVIPIGGSPEEFAAHIVKEYGRAARVIKESGAKFN